MVTDATRRVIQQRLAAERGRIEKSAAWRVALAYPSPYAAAMSSLGYQRIYRALQGLPAVACERVFLPDDAERPGAKVAQPVSYEGMRPLSDFPLVAFSVAYELELAGVVRMLQASDIPLTREQRGEQSPLILAGGPLTFSNPLPLAPFADAIVMGEAEEVVERVIEVLRDSPSRAAALAELAQHEHVFVPAHHGSRLARVGVCDDALLPAYSAIRTPHTELSDMFLVECERGCSRGCTYCVMRRNSGHGMRIVPAQVVLDRVPDDAARVGIVGAAVSDHPEITAFVQELARRGAAVSLSSVRPDRLTDELVGALKSGGCRTLTTALDGASERLRGLVRRRTQEQHFVTAAELARKHGLTRLKLYLMLGLPGETNEDIDECVRLVTELSRIVPVTLGIAPFCAKRNTPLDGSPYAGVRVIDGRLERLRRGLQGRAEVRPTSARWAWIEYVLAQGGEPEALATADAVRAGGRFADYKSAFARLGHRPDEPDGAGI